MRAPILAFLGLASCSDWNLRRNREDPDTGRDVAECEDASRGSVAVADPACERKLGPFDYKVKWKAGGRRLAIANIVMPLFDENGDERVTPADGNHVLAVSGSEYVALRGADGTVAGQFILGEQSDSANAAYLYDGVAYAMGDYGRYRLPSGEMDVPLLSLGGWATPSHADIDGDGHLETAMGPIVDEDGSVLGETPRPKGITTRHEFFADSDGDVKLVTAGGVFRIDGSADCLVPEGLGYGMWADLIGDGQLTLVIPWAGTDGPGLFVDERCEVYETPGAGDGWSWWKLMGGPMGPVLMSGRAATVSIAQRRAADGTMLHNGVVVDLQDGVKAEFDRPSSLAPTADFDGDGVHEVVAIYPDAVRVIDGRDGAVRMELPYASRTIPVDVDRDGALDLVAYTPDGVIVYEGGSAPWARSTMTWQSLIHYPGRYRSDGTTAPPSEWNRMPWFNAAGDDGYRTAVGADLAVTILDVCEVDCETGTLDVTVQPANHGVAALEVPVRVRLFGRVGGQEVLLDEVVVPSIPAATQAESVVLRVREPVLPSELRADIVPDGWLFEGCDEVPDEDRWEEAFCAGP
jgi:hypothetical protein